VREEYWRWSERGREEQKEGEPYEELDQFIAFKR
jgi:hypothetical protein